MSQSDARHKVPSNSGDDDASNPSTGQLFRSLRETAEMHDISPSYLSRCVRAQTEAKGHDLCPYVLFKKNGDEKKIFGFAFPADYEPSDSAVNKSSINSQNRDPQKKAKPEDNTGTTVRREDSRAERYNAAPTNESELEKTKSKLSAVEEEVANLREDLTELVDLLANLTEAIESPSSRRDHRERIERKVTVAINQVQELRREEKEDVRTLRQLLKSRFRQLRESRMEDAKIVDQQFEGINERISELREWVETVVDGARKDLEQSREFDLEDLSTELQEGIRDPILEILGDDDQGESVWANGVGFLAVLAVVEILDKRPDLITQVVDALGGNLTTGKGPLSASSSREGGQEDSNLPLESNKQGEGESGSAHSST